MRTAKTLIRLGGCPADPSVCWVQSHFVGFVTRRLISRLKATFISLPCMNDDAREGKRHQLINLPEMSKQENFPMVTRHPR